MEEDIKKSVVSTADSEGLGRPKQQSVRSVKQYLVFLDEHLGKGQYGQVCRAKLQAEAKQKDAKIFACKIMEVANI